MNEPVIIEAVRIPFGRRNGVYRAWRPDALLAHLLQAVVARTGIDVNLIEDVVTGCVTQAGEQGANIGRLGVMLAGFPDSVAGTTLDRMCGSGQQAVHFMAQAIAAGDMKYGIGCGVENMSRVPMFSAIGGGFERLNPDLLAKKELIHQGESAERIAEQWGLSRDMLDQFSIESHRRATVAATAGLFQELVPIRGLDRDGNEIDVVADEGVRRVIDPLKMSQLATIFRPDGDGVVTAGNASQLADGAAAVLIADRQQALAIGLQPKARFVARVVVGSDPTLQLTGVIPATQKALAKAGLSIEDIDWIEINEAFASVVLSWAKELKPDMAKVNPWGGAIAHGHPLGATGAGLMAKMISGLEAVDGRYGLQTMCIGHGLGIATIIERLV